MNGFSIDLAGFPYYRPGEAMEAARKQLEAACCRPCAAKIHHQTVAIDGSPGEGILATAVEVQADLIVMGTRCYRGLDKWLHGSIAEQVLRGAPIPVITVGPHARKAAAAGLPIKSILFATSLQGESTDAVNLQLIFRWIKRLQGHLTLLHVAPDSHGEPLARERTCQTRELQLRQLLPEDAFRTHLVEAHVLTGSASREILAASADADLIALGAVRQPMLGRLAPEGTLNQILAEAHCPVATFHSEHTRARPA
jgi:nucleotide-binding universal stress UspA family protein